jgi:hypothetical protein
VTIVPDSPRPHPALGAHRRQAPQVPAFPLDASRLPFLLELKTRYAEDAAAVGDCLLDRGWSVAAVYELLGDMAQQLADHVFAAIELGADVWLATQAGDAA